MITKTNKSNWILDAIILVGFLLTFFLDLTGIILHQWLGVAVFLLIIVHLVKHADWVKTVFSRFLLKTPARTKLYWVIDFLMLFGMVVIVETGLMISTWFNLELANYLAWYDLHLYSSIATLALAAFKLALHWRWIASTTKKLFARQPQSAMPVAPLGNTAALSRRQFLTSMGVISLGSAMVIGNVLSKNGLLKVSASSDAATALDATATSTQASTATQAATETQPTQTTVAQTVDTATPTAEPTATATAAATSTTVSQTTLVCSRSCRKGRHCSYPGQCHDYTDSDGNGLCDLGECG